jgi:hypothetical protein
MAKKKKTTRRRSSRRPARRRGSNPERTRRKKAEARNAALAGSAGAYFAADYFGQKQAEMEAAGATTFEVGGREIDKLTTAGAVAAVGMALYPLKSKLATEVIKLGGVAAMSTARGVAGYKLRTAELAAGG